MEHLNVGLLEYATASPANINTKREMLVRDKYSSLLQNFVNYERKSFMTMRPASRGQEYRRRVSNPGT
jgi:hypothetical protein